MVVVAVLDLLAQNPNIHWASELYEPIKEKKISKNLHQKN